MILGLGLLVLTAALVNTANEELVDVIFPGLDLGAKKAKDCGSAAVALAVLAGGAPWVVEVQGMAGR